jgi:hypothetical protein
MVTENNFIYVLVGIFIIFLVVNFMTNQEKFVVVQSSAPPMPVSLQGPSFSLSPKSYTLINTIKPKLQLYVDNLDNVISTLQTQIINKSQEVPSPYHSTMYISNPPIMPTDINNNAIVNALTKEIKNLQITVTSYLQLRNSLANIDVVDLVVNQLTSGDCDRLLDLISTRSDSIDINDLAQKIGMFKSKLPTNTATVQSALYIVGCFVPASSAINNLLQA